MSPSVILANEPLAASAFQGHSGGLWDAIVDKIALRDPAGPAPFASTWLAEPTMAERGMFDFVSPTTSG